jgi:hypothetical protein
MFSQTFNALISEVPGGILNSSKTMEGIINFEGIYLVSPQATFSLKNTFYYSLFPLKSGRDLKSEVSQCIILLNKISFLSMTIVRSLYESSRLSASLEVIFMSGFSLVKISFAFWNFIFSSSNIASLSW